MGPVMRNNLPLLFSPTPDVLHSSMSTSPTGLEETRGGDWICIPKSGWKKKKDVFKRQKFYMVFAEIEILNEAKRAS